MEITSQDLKKLKISPTLIAFLKAVHLKDSKYLGALNNVDDIFRIANHLQKKLIIKIIDDKISHKSFEIRNLDVVRYLNDETYSNSDLAREIFNYFSEVMTKYSGKVSRAKFATMKSFLIGRVNQGVEVDTAKEVIDMKFEEWWGTKYQHHLNFRTLLGSTHYPQYIQQLDLRVEKEPELNINTMI